VLTCRHSLQRRVHASMWRGHWSSMWSANDWCRINSLLEVLARGAFVVGCERLVSVRAMSLNQPDA